MTRKSYKVEELWLYVGIDQDGDEGVAAFQQPNGNWMPMLCADKHRLAHIRPIAEGMRASGVKLKLVHLATRRDVPETEEMFLALEGTREHVREETGESGDND